MCAVNKIQARIVEWLMPKGNHVLRSFMEALVAGDREILDKVRPESVIERIGNALRLYPFLMFLAVKATLFLLEYAAPLMTHTWQRFTRMPLEERVRYLEGWEYSALDMQRGLFLLIKASTLTALCAEPEMLDFAGYSNFMRYRQERLLGKTEVPSCPKNQTN